MRAFARLCLALLLTEKWAYAESMQLTHHYDSEPLHNTVCLPFIGGKNSRDPSDSVPDLATVATQMSTRINYG